MSSWSAWPPWLDVPIGVATSTFCAITLGIGVDYAIHFLERVERSDGGAQARLDRVLRAVREAGPAIVADALAVALGFGALCLSQVPANARLGGLVAVSLLSAAALSLCGLGALLVEGWIGASGQSPRPPGRGGIRVTPG